MSGKRVKVTVEVPVHEVDAWGTWVHFPGSGQGPHGLVPRLVNLTWHPEYEVEEAEPENWPPQAGDVWEAQNGREYYVRNHRFTPGVLVAAPFDSAKSLDLTGPDLDEFRALNPTLIRRR